MPWRSAKGRSASPWNGGAMRRRSRRAIISAWRMAKAGATGFTVPVCPRNGSCMGFSHDSLCRNRGDDELLVPARRLASQGIGAMAAELGHAAIGIADRNTLAGVVRAYAALQEIEDNRPKLLVGARLVFADGTPDILAYPTDRAAYGRLCRLAERRKTARPQRRMPSCSRRSPQMAGGPAAGGDGAASGPEGERRMTPQKFLEQRPCRAR